MTGSYGDPVDKTEAVRLSPEQWNAIKFLFDEPDEVGVDGKEK